MASSSDHGHGSPSDRPDLSIPTLGRCGHDSPISGDELIFVEDSERLLYEGRVSRLASAGPLSEQPSFELAGPRRKVYFHPGGPDGQGLTAGIVTCGGLCPGLNDVIRGLVMVLHHRYGVKRILGFRNGYKGLTAPECDRAMLLEPDRVGNIHELGGTILGSSRGNQPPEEVVRTLAAMKVSMLFVIGGDGTMRGGLRISEEIQRRKLDIAVVGVPKTIDNDILFVNESFGFQTAYSEAVESLRAAHVEAKGAPEGIGLVKLMGRHSGFIACHASLANPDVNFVLIPEVPFALEGPRGFLETLRQRMLRRRHAVIVVAEGAGQEHLAVEPTSTDASGNVRLKDIGTLMRERIEAYFRRHQQPVNLKYIDPSYLIRSVPARPPDSLYCLRLAQNAAHAAMTGRTRCLVGRWHDHFVHVPMVLATSGRQVVDPHGDLWQSVLEATGQPREMV